MSLDSLPHDLLFVLEEYIGASGSHILRSCSTIFTIYKPAYPLHDILANNYFYLFSYLNEIGYQMNESELPKLAIRHNNLAFLEHILDRKKCEFTDIEVVQNAAYYGSMEILQKYAKYCQVIRYTPMNLRIWKYAIAGKQLEIVKWLHENEDIPHDPCVLKKAAEFGAEEIFDYLLELDYEYDVDECICGAIKGNQLNWLKSHIPEYVFFSIATVKKQLHIIVWKFYNGFYSNEV
jgi:hypothetical protein